MIEQNKKIFSLLSNRIMEDLETSQRKIYSGRRHIKTKGDLDAENWEKNARFVGTQPLFGYYQSAIFSIEDDVYFVYVGESKIDELINGFEPIEINGGVFTVVVGDIGIPVRGTPMSVFKSVSLQEFDDDYAKESLGKWAYEWSDLQELFIPFCVYKISKESPISAKSTEADDLSRITAYFLIKTKKHLTLEFEDDTLSEYEKIITEGSFTSGRFPYEKLLLSLIAIKWKYAFLETYRCLELLFSVSAIATFHDEIRQKMHSEYDLLNFANDIEAYLGWRPNEKKTIDDIVDQASDEIKDLLVNAKNRTPYQDYTIAKFFYQTRNDSVHLRAGQKEPNLDHSKWNLLIRATLRLVKHWHTKYENHHKLAHANPNP